MCLKYVKPVMRLLLKSQQVFCGTICGIVRRHGSLESSPGILWTDHIVDSALRGIGMLDAAQWSLRAEQRTLPGEMYTAKWILYCEANICRRFWVLLFGEWSQFHDAQV